MKTFQFMELKQQLIAFQKFTQGFRSKEQQQMYGKKSAKKGFSFICQAKRRPDLMDDIVKDERCYNLVTFSGNSNIPKNGNCD